MSRRSSSPLYWKGKKQPLFEAGEAWVWPGACRRFSEYGPSRSTNRDAEGHARRDVLFMSHAKPKDEAQAALWKKLAAKRAGDPRTTWGSAALGRCGQEGDLRAADP